MLTTIGRNVQSDRAALWTEIAESCAAGRGRIESRAMRPVSATMHDRRPARARLRPPLRPLAAARVHRPFPRRLPARAARSGRGRRRRALSAARVRRLDGHGDRGGRAAAPDPRARVTAGARTGSRRSPSGSSPRARPALRGQLTFWTEPPTLFDRSRELLGSRAALRAATGSARWRGCRRSPRSERPVERVAVAGRRPPPGVRRASPAVTHMLPPAMSRRRSPSCCARAALALAGAVSPRAARRRRSDVVEGEPLELGDLQYNVQLTRFLNPDDTEDAEYLVGQPPPTPGTLPRRLPGDRERGRRAAAVGRRLHGHRHARQRVRAGREREPLRARPRREVPAEGELPRPTPPPRPAPPRARS